MDHSNPYRLIQILYGYTHPSIANHLCQSCTAIPWARLPSEDEAAYPHQPSIRALKDSSATCRLCLVLSFAIQAFQRQLDFETTHDLNEVPVPIKAVCPPLNDETILRYMGWNHLASFERIDLRRLHHLDEGQGTHDAGHTNNEDEEHIWLYGNWWIKELPGSPPDRYQYQLIGIGVRLSQRARPWRTQCTPPGSPLLIHRGSQIRICVNHSK